MYDHLVTESRAALEERSKGIIEDEITDSVNEFIEGHNRRMELIATIYDKQKPATQD